MVRFSPMTVHLRVAYGWGPTNIPLERVQDRIRIARDRRLKEIQASEWGSEDEDLLVSKDTD